MRRMLILGFAMVACVVGFSVNASTDIIYKDDKVTVTETLHSYIPFSVHVGVSDVISINVFGEKYKDVRGTAPYYLEIPGTNLILFVTGPDHNGSGKAVVHLVNMDTKMEVHFPAYDSHIGSNICSPEKQTEFEKVESVTTNELVISAGFLDRRYHYYLDLKKPAFEKEVGDSYVWPQGKAH